MSDPESASAVVIASFDCTSQGEASMRFCASQGARALPHVRYYEGRDYTSDYLGTRSFNDLLVFLEQEAGVGPFPILSGLRRFKAVAFRLLCSLMSWVMETHGETGPKPSGRALITFGLVVGIPLVTAAVCCLGCMWMCVAARPSPPLPRRARSRLDDDDNEDIDDGRLAERKAKEHDADLNKRRKKET